MKPIEDTTRRWLNYLIPMLVMLGGVCNPVAAQEDNQVTTAKADQYVILVQGAAGENQYGEMFANWIGHLKQTVTEAKIPYQLIGDKPDSKTSDLEKLKASVAKTLASSANEVWIVLIGHGTYDGKRAKFNLSGPDLMASRLAEWIGDSDKQFVIVNCSSASSPFLNKLSGPNRVVLTATKSGSQYNFARFGEHFSQSIADPAFDLDKDGQTSLLEAFIAASNKVNEFYESDQRLATEHALLDDNGDKLGTSADWFTGIRATKTAKSGVLPDGLKANQIVLVRQGVDEKLSVESRARRNQLEQQLEEIRTQKNTLGEQAYLSQIEPIMLKLAKIYGDAESDQLP